MAGNPRQRQRYATGIGVSLILHGLLISLWQLSQPPRRADDAPSSSMLLRLLPARPAEPALTQPRSTAAAPARQAPAGQSSRQASRVTRAAPPAEQQVIAVTPPAQQSDTPAAAPAPSARDMLSRARAAVGDIDRRLRRENPQRGIVAPVVTAQMKLEKGIAEAADLAPNKWYQAPKTQEIMDPGGYGRKRYRVVGAAGTYCVTYESNHAPDGLDTMRSGIKPKTSSCPPNEGPPTIQKWNN